MLALEEHFVFMEIYNFYIIVKHILSFTFPHFPHFFQQSLKNRVSLQKFCFPLHFDFKYTAIKITI